MSNSDSNIEITRNLSNTASKVWKLPSLNKFVVAEIEFEKRIHWKQQESVKNVACSTVSLNWNYFFIFTILIALEGAEVHWYCRYIVEDPFMAGNSIHKKYGIVIMALFCHCFISFCALLAVKYRGPFTTSSGFQLVVVVWKKLNDRKVYLTTRWSDEPLLQISIYTT